MKTDLPSPVAGLLHTQGEEPPPVGSASNAEDRTDGKEEVGGLGQVWSYLGAWTEPRGGCGQLSSPRLGIFILKEVGSCDHQRRLSGPSVAQGSVHREWQLRRGVLPICNSRTCHCPSGAFEGAHWAQASSDPAGDSIRCAGTWLLTCPSHASQRDGRRTP